MMKEKGICCSKAHAGDVQSLCASLVAYFVFLCASFFVVMIGVGDTFGTCFGPLSRNRKFGYRLGKGETMAEILESTTEVAEGVDTALAVVNLIETKCKGYRLDLKYPILFGIAKILKGELSPLEGLEGLMNMPMQMENFDEGRIRER